MRGRQKKRWEDNIKGMDGNGVRRFLLDNGSGRRGLGRAMVLGSFQCWGILLLWYMVGQGPAVLAAGAGWVGYFLFYFFISSVLSSFSNASSVGRRLDILKYFGLGHYNPAVVVSYYRRLARLVVVNRLVGLTLPRNSENG